MSLQATEKKILKGCNAGKAKYQQMLYELYYGKMMSVCLRYAKNHEEARDILQEGYIKVFQNINTFKGNGSLEGWVRRIMVNTAINYFHKNKKFDANTSIDDDYKELEEDFFNDKAILQKLAYDDILKLVRSLSPAYQTVFNLHVIEGYNHKEIAEMLNINVGTSKSNLAKARAKLQKQLNILFKNQKDLRYA